MWGKIADFFASREDLIKAIKAGDITESIRLTDKVGVNAIGAAQYGVSPLLTAIEAKKTEFYPLIFKLLNMGASANAPFLNYDNKQCSLLQLCIDIKIIDITCLLAVFGADIKKIDWKYLSAKEKQAIEQAAELYRNEIFPYLKAVTVNNYNQLTNVWQNKVSKIFSEPSLKNCCEQKAADYANKAAELVKQQQVENDAKKASANTAGSSHAGIKVLAASCLTDGVAGLRHRAAGYHRL